MLHAVGVAQAIKYNNEAQVVVAACGDGATSEGDFNEALNFAGVFKAPVVFVVQNNGWAISTPRCQQSAAEHLANRGPGFGIPSCVVDGNDVLAVYQVVSEAITQIDRAVEAYEALPSPDPRQQFKHIYAEMSPQLQRQQENLLRDLEFV